MLRWTQPIMNEEALDTLKEQGLKKYADVWTSDDKRLGVALRFHYRSPAEVEPDLKLYAAYLHVQSINLGGPAYIPTEFIDHYDPAANRVTLTADLRFLEDELWNRMPDFVARGQGREEELPI